MRIEYHSTISISLVISDDAKLREHKTTIDRESPLLSKSVMPLRLGFYRASEVYVRSSRST